MTDGAVCTTTHQNTTAAFHGAQGRPVTHHQMRPQRDIDGASHVLGLTLPGRVPRPLLPRPGRPVFLGQAPDPRLGRQYTAHDQLSVEPGMTTEAMDRVRSITPDATLATWAAMRSPTCPKLSQVSEPHPNAEREAPSLQRDTPRPAEAPAVHRVREAPQARHEPISSSDVSNLAGSHWASISSAPARRRSSLCFAPQMRSQTAPMSP